MKLCKDCKYCVIKTAWITRDKTYQCHEAVRHAIDPVSGEDIIRGEIVLCDTARGYDIFCGQEGRFWEAK